MTNIVCVVALHPDDETLGAGGTLLKHKERGDQVHWIICTEMKREEGFSKALIERREREIETVADGYGFDGVHRLGLSTMKVDQYSMTELVESVSNAFLEIRPNTVYLPFKSDIHSDHRVMFEAAYSCTKVFRFPFVKRVLMMEVLSETDFAPATKENGFVPNVFVDVSKYLHKKLKIMQVFEAELAEPPFPRSLQNIEALGKVRGGAAGCIYAEGFMLLKEIF